VEGYCYVSSNTSRLGGCVDLELPSFYVRFYGSHLVMIDLETSKTSPKANETIHSPSLVFVKTAPR
jgi:hypothetical protein